MDPPKGKDALILEKQGYFGHDNVKVYFTFLLVEFYKEIIYPFPLMKIIESN